MSIPRIGDRVGANEGLPLGYRRCEYLESTGTQWIDTGFTATNNTGLYAEWMFNGQGANHNQHVLSCTFLYCARPRKVNNVWIAQGIIGANNSSDFELTFGKKNISSTNFQNSKTINFNETTIKVYEVIAPPRDKVILCGYSDLNASYLFCGRIYSAKISEGTEIVRNLVPALDPNNRPCMFDTVTSTPLYNQGTGEFLYKVISPETAYIPANFTRVGYLESNGTQYIDTGIKLSNESEVRCEFEQPYQTGQNQYIAGAWNAYNIRNYTILAESLLHPDRIYAYCLDSGSYSMNWTNAQEYGKKRNMYISSKYAMLDGVKRENPVSPGPFETTNAYLFALHAENGSFNRAISRIYSFSISRNGQLQCNLIPCLDGDDVPCMYDTVSQTALYKAVGDQFLYGEDEEASKKLPAGYTKMNYLESTGTQWIDTGIKLSSESEAKCTYELMAETPGVNQYLFDAQTNKSVPSFIQFGFTLYNLGHPDSVYGYVRSSTAPQIKTLRPEGKTSITLNKKGLTLNGVFLQGVEPEEFILPLNCYLFADNFNDRVSSLAYVRVYSFSISRNGELQLDLQPCLDPYGVPCMYDFVSKRPLYKEDNGDDGDQFLYG